MAAIRKISAKIVTSNIENAGTDGDVYLGICGREFYLDSSADDFERGSNRTYILGDGSNVLNSRENDPRNPQLDSARLDDFPVYIRFEPQGENADWNLSFVSVEVAGRNYGVNFQRGLWLGRKVGKFCYLREGKFSE
jgi:hypothetical protein